MEELLRELIAVNREMLNEIRMLRQSLCQEPTRPEAAPGLGVVADAAGLSRGADEPESFRPAPPRYTPKDLEDIRGQLMEGLKKTNRDKSNAFAEFEKRHKDW
jgi:hypothetical protein